MIRRVDDTETFIFWATRIGVVHAQKGHSIFDGILANGHYRISNRRCFAILFCQLEFKYVLWDRIRDDILYQHWIVDISEIQTRGFQSPDPNANLPWTVLWIRARFFGLRVSY